MQINLNLNSKVLFCEKDLQYYIFQNNLNSKQEYKYNPENFGGEITVSCHYKENSTTSKYHNYFLNQVSRVFKVYIDILIGESHLLKLERYRED